MKTGTRLLVGAGILGVFALITGLAALVYGPGKTLRVDQVSSAVLQLEDVPGVRRVENCDDEEPVDREPLPENAVFVVFRLAEDASSDTPPVCIQVGATVEESHAGAVAAFQESVDFFPEYEKAVEAPSLEGAVNLEPIKIRRFGHRSFSYTLGCGRDCTTEDSRSYIIQFQRANVLSFIVISGPEKDDLLDDAIDYARKQDQRVVAALNAND